MKKHQRTVLESIEHVNGIRAVVFAFYADAEKLHSVHDLVNFGVLESIARARTLELLEAGKLWPCKDADGKSCFTTNPHMATGYAIIVCKDIINQFKDFPGAQVDFVYAIKQYVIERQEVIHFLFDQDGAIERLWKQEMKPRLDKVFFDFDSEELQ